MLCLRSSRLLHVNLKSKSKISDAVAPPKIPSPIDSPNAVMGAFGVAMKPSRLLTAEICGAGAASEVPKMPHVMMAMVVTALYPLILLVQAFLILPGVPMILLAVFLAAFLILYWIF